MIFSLRRFICAVFVAAMTGGSASVAHAVSPDFYGIKMNSENHARDLAPDELALFPVRRGFDKNVYAYGHLDVNFNKTRSITFNIFNNTDNDLLIEKSFREYYVVLRNGERYRLDEPGMAMSIDRVDARGKGTLRAEFGDLNVTKEQIEMVVCSFDMGKVKIVLLPIALDPPPPMRAEEAERLSAPRPQKDPAGVYAKDQVEQRLRGENEIKHDKPGRGRFPVMDLPIFSWLKNASSRPETDIKPVPSKARQQAAASTPVASPPSKTNITPKASAAAPAKIEPIAPLPGTGAKEDKPPARRGFFASVFSIFDPNLRREPAPFNRATEPKKSNASKISKSPRESSPAAAQATSGEKEFFWKPRDLTPIQPIDSYEKRKVGTEKSNKDAEKPALSAREPQKAQVSEAKPFYMRRGLDESVRVPEDEPVTAVSSPNAKNKAPLLSPEKKLRRVGPRTDAKVVQVNGQMGFIVVNAGAPDGVRENMVFNVYRRGKIIAKAAVRKVNDDASAAILMKDWAREDVAVGDPVSFY